MNQSYQVKLETFEGPLDLLLHLINQYEIDIYDIPVAVITEQYMHFIQTMQRLELNIASEYLVMASTLLVMKSEMLLPKHDITEQDLDYEEDPREELMRRLIAYRQYKGAAEQFQEREAEGIQTFTRPPLVYENTAAHPEVVKGDVSIYDMLQALDKVFERKQWNEPVERTMRRTDISIEQRMHEVLTAVSQSYSGIAFNRLFPVHTRAHIVATFMALLELMKSNQVYCKQETHFGDLYVFHMEA